MAARLMVDARIDEKIDCRCFMPAEEAQISRSAGAPEVSQVEWVNLVLFRCKREGCFLYVMIECVQAASAVQSFDL